MTSQDLSSLTLTLSQTHTVLCVA